MNIRMIFLGSVLGLLILVAGCFEQPFPGVGIEAFYTAETLCGTIRFRISAGVATHTTIQKVDVFVDNELFVSDEVPVETHHDEGMNLDQYLFPDHYWDSTPYSDGWHVMNAVVYTSNGTLGAERLYKISNYMIDAEVTVGGPDGNSAKASVYFYNGGTKSKVADALVDIKGVQMNWDGTQEFYLTPANPVIPGMAPGENFTMNFSIPGGTEISNSYIIIEPFIDFRTTTDIEQWISGQVNNLHLIWGKRDYGEETESQFEIVGYDSMMNELAINEKEIPQLTNEYECNLSRAIIPDNLKYIKINLKSICRQENSQYYNDPDPAVIYETKVIQYSTPIKNF